MTARIHTSAPVERSFMRDRRWQNPGRREHLFGRVQGLSDIKRPAFINRIAQALKGAGRQQCRSGK